MTPCMRLYAHLGTSLDADRAGPYARVGPHLRRPRPSRRSPRTLEALLDRHAADDAATRRPTAGRWTSSWRSSTRASTGLLERAAEQHRLGHQLDAERLPHAVAHLPGGPPQVGRRRPAAVDERERVLGRQPDGALAPALARSRLFSISQAADTLTRPSGSTCSVRVAPRGGGPGPQVARLLGRRAAGW